MTEGDGDGVGLVESAVRAELARMGAGVAESARGAMAIDLARRQDGAWQPNFAAQVAKELREVLKELRADHPPQEKADGVDELRRRREQRGAS